MHKAPNYKPWGKMISIDLYDCDHKKVASAEIIKKYIADVIKLIKMKAHGPTHIDRFGSGELEGWSAMQFIETSSITIHADEFDNRCFVDIFSCKPFDDQKALAFTIKTFGSKSHRVLVMDR
jgi:S-adenosylmethionine decarboxylase